MSHTRSHRATPDVYHCSGDWYGWKQCLNARVYDHLAHDFIRDAFLERCVFTILTETGARAGTPRTLWDEATLPEQQRLLGLVIERVDMTPLEVPINRNDWPTTLRHRLNITQVAKEEASASAVHPRYIKLEDVAAYLSVSSAQVYAMVRSGDLPAIKIGGRGVWRVDRNKLDDYLDRLEEETAAWARANPLNVKDKGVPEEE